MKPKLIEEVISRADALMAVVEITTDEFAEEICRLSNAIADLEGALHQGGTNG